MEFLIGRPWYAEEEIPETRPVTAAPVSKLYGLGMSSREGVMYARTRSDECASGQLTDSLSDQHSRAFPALCCCLRRPDYRGLREKYGEFKTLIGNTRL